jgi:hypothetical protein
VWASLEQSPHEVVTAMFDEAAQRDPKGQKLWIALVDGNESQIEHLQRLAEERKVPLLLVVDFIHVAQYVWEAAPAFFPGHETEQDSWVRAHLLEILRGKASLVAAGMRRSATLRAMNLTGARWSLSGAEAVLHLRALRASDDFDTYWEFHEKHEYERNHASHYADHHVPETVVPATFSSGPNRRSTLKIVKKQGES